jgi:hypothetical protein
MAGCSMCVMPALVAGIHAFSLKDVDARHKAGHDGSAQRVTTTGVPTLTRPNRSLMSWLYMRMQP